ncbi:MAG: helix-turn-helix transcriptional regulator [Granulosicoccus sp.]
MSEYRPAKRRVEVSPGESLRILRELQELSQNELAEISGIPQSTISAIENGRVQLGVERTKVLARALSCHLAALVFPDWDVNVESTA